METDLKLLSELGVLVQGSSSKTVLLDSCCLHFVKIGFLMNINLHLLIEIKKLL
jgi:hypothetical protein